MPSRVLVAGATGVIGRQLVPLLDEAGVEVIALSRHTTAAASPRVHPIAVDALDRDAVFRAVRESRPDAIVHLLTAIPQQIRPRRMHEDFSLTNRLRTEGTANLLDAGHEVGVGRIVTQSLAWAYDPAGTGDGDTGPATEDAPFWRDPPATWRSSRDALVRLEQLTAEAGGLALRFGHLYGPATGFAADGDMTRQVRERAMPIVGRGTGCYSFTHTHDAATATLAALSDTSTGALNVVDDEPALIRDWLPHLAEVLGAPAPRQVPTLAARLFAGAWGVAFMTALRGADNTRARTQLGWSPRYPSWREGFRAELVAATAA